MSNPKTIVIDGATYVLREESAVVTENYVIIRSQGSGVHAGYLESRDGGEVVLSNARRIWYWEGAASLSQLAMEGTSKPGSCKFPMAVTSITVLNVLEIIPCTEAARASIEGVKVWKQ